MSKLRVLHLFNSYLPQSENWAYSLIKNVPNAEIHIGALHFLKNNFYNPEFLFIDNYFDEFRKLNRNLGKSKPIDILKKAVIKSIPLVFGNYINNLISYTRKNRIDILHCHFADIGWHFLKVAHKTKLPLVVSFYGWDYEKLPYTKPEFVSKFNVLFKNVAAIICEGQHAAKNLTKWGCPIEKIHIVQLGVETSKIPIFTRHKDKNKLKLIQIASFTEKKGHIYSVRAFAKTLKTCPNLELTLVGDDKDPKSKQEVVNFIHEQNLIQKIKILDFVDFSKLHSFLKDFHVFIHPSIHAKDKDCEGGAPIILLDAQATGMPVISTTHCDIPSEVIHAKTGLLSPEKDVESLAKSIKLFYEMDTETFHQYSLNARTHIEQQFEITKNAKILGDVYKLIISNK